MFTTTSRRTWITNWLRVVQLDLPLKETLRRSRDTLEDLKLYVCSGDFIWE